MSGEGKSDRIFWKAVDFSLIIIYLILVSLPFLRAYGGSVSFERQVDPTFLNGLLTASSILFGFSSVLVIGQKPVQMRTWVLLLPPLILTILAGIQIVDVALGSGNSVFAVLMLSTSFHSNMVTTALIVGHFTGLFWKKRKGEGV